ncbi:MAG: hypothetical protein JOZ43_09035 [Acidobacteriales bacterium]|nr:hypothetical protein [Terriglobales bacterium]
MIAQGAQDSAVSAATPGAPSVSSLQQDLEKAQQNLSDLKSRYTPDHPDVVSAQRDVDALQAKVNEADKAAAAAIAKPVDTTKPTHDTPQLAQMRVQLQGVTQAIEDKRREQERIRERLAQVQARVQSSPVVQEQQKELTRDYQTALQFYNELLAKQQNSEMAGDLEKKQQGEQFRVMDPPNLPDKPAFPDPRIFLGGGFALAIMMSLGLTAWLEYRDHSIRNERDIFAFTQLPTLGMIPISAAAIPTGGMKGLLPKKKAKEYASVSE